MAAVSYDPVKNEELGEKYKSLIPEFVAQLRKKSMFRSQAAIPARKLTFWINAASRTYGPLEDGFYELDQEAQFTRVTKENLIDFYELTRAYVEAFFRAHCDDQGLVPRQPVVSLQQFLGHKYTYGHLTDAERLRVYLGFVRLWTLCYILQYRRYWLRDEDETRELMRAYFDTLPTLWDAFAISRCYKWIHSQLAAKTMSSLKDDRYKRRRDGFRSSSRGWVCLGNKCTPESYLLGIIS